MKWQLALAYLPFLGLDLFAPASSISQQPGGLQPGAKAPAFTLSDQAGKKQDLDTLAGPNGLLLLFFRSADWCPFCKGQLVDLEASQKAFEAEGINVAAVSYDSRAILENFAQRRSITYPLLSDSGSKLIDKFGIRNPEGKGIEAGIPYPGYYLIDRDGTIRKRFFETAYVNRLTASNLYGYLFHDFPLAQPAKQVNGTPHVTITTNQSDTDVTPWPGHPACRQPDLQDPTRMFTVPARRRSIASPPSPLPRRTYIAPPQSVIPNRSLWSSRRFTRPFPSIAVQRSSPPRPQRS